MKINFTIIPGRLALGLIMLIMACQSKSEQTETHDPNPAAEGFNWEASDQQAIATADRVMEAMGGRKAWDETQYIGWDFFGARQHLWDKHNGHIRIEMPSQKISILMNINTMQGRVKKGDHIYTKADSLDHYLDLGYAWWINDSYWLVMPYKLKDSGVSLKYIGKDSLQNGSVAEVLQLTFQEVGKTPDNKYLIYVDTNDYLIKQWAFFSKAENETPNFIAPWDNYQRHGNILLSGSRLGERRISDVKVLDSLDQKIFFDF